MLGCVMAWGPSPATREQMNNSSSAAVRQAQVTAYSPLLTKKHGGQLLIGQTLIGWPGKIRGAPWSHCSHQERHLHACLQHRPDQTHSPDLSAKETPNQTTNMMPQRPCTTCEITYQNNFNVFFYIAVFHKVNWLLPGSTVL